MKYAAYAAWVAFCAVWLIGAFGTKAAQRRPPLPSIALHFLILAVGFSLVKLRSWRWLPELDAAGCVLQVLGLAFAIWARLHLGRNWSPAISVKQGHTLIRSGPYAIVRHPIYSGLLLACFGVALGYGSVSGLLGFAILAAEWKRKSLIEERFMEEQFGAEYQRYRREVNGLIPRRTAFSINLKP